MPKTALGWWLAARTGLAVLLGLPASVQASSSSIHVVEPGDTLWKLARARGCSVEQLRAANPRHDALHPGDTLVVPPCTVSKSSTAYTVEPGDTLSALALRWDVDLDLLRDHNGIRGSTIRIGQRLLVPPKEPAPPRWVAGQSSGRPQRGRLHDGQQLPSDPAYFRRRPQRAWGATHVVQQVRSAVAAVRMRHPRVHRLAIGDLSAPRGGPISEHHSHQSGRDVDLGLYYQKRPAGYPQAFVPRSAAALDLAATWSLIEALYEQSRHPGGPEKIFLDYEIQKELYLYAREQGISKNVLGKIFQYPQGPWTQGRLVQHVRKHDDHVHVRFACPPDDAGCQ